MPLENSENSQLNGDNLDKNTVSYNSPMYCEHLEIFRGSWDALH